MNEKQKEMITNSINNISFPEHFEKENGAVKPNQIAKNNAIKVCEILYEYVNMPSIIASSTESGIYLLFNINNKYDFYVETYNNRKISSIIIDKKIKTSIIHSELINEFDFELTFDKINELRKED